MKKKILIVYGGKSCEHDISVLTALQAMKNIDGHLFEVYPLYIKEGLYTGKALEDIGTYESFNPDGAGIKACAFHTGGIELRRFACFKRNVDIDCALLCCHGGEGENGGIQGLLEYYRIPYTSAGVAASALFMDKIMTKEWLIGKKLPVLPYFSLRDSDTDKIRLPRGTDYPLIVKPASLGSSIGIAVAHNREELKESIAVAAEFDGRIVVEKALTDVFEINCAAVKTSGEILVSECERPVSWREFLTFEEKYCGGKAGISGLSREYPASIPKNLRKAVQNFTKKIYIDSGLKGVVRIDFLFDKTKKRLYVNEVNTIPGSLAFYLFKENGLSFKDLLSSLIAESISDYHKRSLKIDSFESDVLKSENIKNGGKGSKGAKSAF